MVQAEKKSFPRARVTSFKLTETERIAVRIYCRIARR